MLNEKYPQKITFNEDSYTLREVYSSLKKISEALIEVLDKIENKDEESHNEQKISHGE